MKKSILLSNHYDGTPLTVLKDAIKDDFDLIVLDKAVQEELYEKVPLADYLLVSGRLTIDEALLNRAGRLKMIQRTGVGIDNLDLAGIKSRGIPLYVNRGVNAVSVAEHTVMLMLSAIKKTYKVNRQMREGIWKKQQTGLTTHELAGRTVGLIGMGSIGRLVAKMLGGFNVRILYYDQIRLEPEMEDRLMVTYAGFYDVLARADILSLHAGYDPEAGYLLAEDEFACMKEGSVLINTARGKLVKETALIEALQTGRLSACGIDTYETEPPVGVSLLAAFDQAMLSPHIAGVSYEAFARMMGQAVANIRCFDQGDLAAIEESRRI